LGLTISNFRGYRTKKALFLVGDGDSGKSQIKSLAEYLVGYKNITTVDLKTLNERFGASALYQKRLAGCNDMNYEKIKDMSIFKQLTGGDTINIEFKGMSSFNYLYKGVLWFNCNELPQFSGDQGKWVYDRFMIIYCNNVIPKEKQDPYLLDKMKKEKNTIIKLALMSLKQLMDNKFKLEEPSRSKELRDQYEIKNNTLLTFVEKYCEIKEDIKHYERLKKTEFRQAYDNYIKLYCNGKGKVTGERMDKILAKHYGETYRKSSIWYMRKIVLTKAGKEELGLIYVDESRSSDIVWEN
jgi:P4 family phage/plasmid primase-like protien